MKTRRFQQFKEMYKSIIGQAFYFQSEKWEVVDISFVLKQVKGNNMEEIFFFVCESDQGKIMQLEHESHANTLIFRREREYFGDVSDDWYNEYLRISKRESIGGLN